MTNFFKNIFIFVITTIICLFIIELSLRYIWSPVQIRTNIDNIIPGKKTVIDNYYEYEDQNKIRNHIRTVINTLGFRGEEPPFNFLKNISIITVGGSTTECIMITEGKTWQDILKNNISKKIKDVWINNAGVDGHSTFGHIKMLENKIVDIKPNIAMFLVGINDVPLESSNTYDDSWNIIEKNKKNDLIYYSAIYRIINYIFSIDKIGTHKVVNWGDYVAKYSKEQGELLNPIFNKDKDVLESRTINYENRLKKIIKICKDNGINPVFITQPAVYGFSIDETTGADLEKIIIHDWTEAIPRSGKYKWQILEMFNDITRKVAVENEVLLIDLAKELPKNTDYFYDYIHYSEKGAEEVAKVINKSLCPYLQYKYPDHIIEKCN